MMAGRRASVRLTTISKLSTSPEYVGSLSGFSDRYGHNRGAPVECYVMSVCRRPERGEAGSRRATLFSHHVCIYVDKSE
jgi:hypothetical protein